MNTIPTRISWSGDAFPLLADRQRGNPFVLDLSDHTSLSVDMFRNQEQLQEYIEQHLFVQRSWGIAAYLEQRPLLLSRFPQMQRERRFMHLGIDVIAPLHTPLHTPVEGVVYEAAYEEGEGNYGGYVVLEHQGDGGIFFSLFGHLDIASLPKRGQWIERGEAFARMGDLDCNGHWFIHTHVQLCTPRAVEEGWIHRGYCTEEQSATMEALCPSPYRFIGYASA